MGVIGVSFVLNTMRTLSMSISLLLSVTSCVATKNQNQNRAYGGLFPNKPAIQDQPIESAEFEVSNIAALKLPPDAETAASPSVMSRVPRLPFKVDTLPPDSLRNEADLMYAKADKQLKKYISIKQNLWKYELVYFLSTTPLVVFGIATLEAEMAFAGFFTQFLIVLAGMSIVGTWITLALVLLSLPGAYLKSAANNIKRAPKFAPKERRIEYEIRSILMLGTRLNRHYVKKKIKIIKELAQTDPYNPWLDKLPQLEEISKHARRNIGWKVLLAYYGSMFLFGLISTLFFP